MQQGSTPSMQRKAARAPVPGWAKTGLVILVVGSWVPLAFFARSRVAVTDRPPVLLFQDMASQPRFSAQAANELFADGRAMRPRVDGTVARGHLEEDDHFHRGYRREWNAAAGAWEVKFMDGLPKQVRVNEALLRRGQERYGIFCSSCHGLDGYGNGPVNARAVELQEPRWIPAASLHTEMVRQRAEGHLFNTITHGIRTMPPHGAQIPVEDRWAIVAYVRALQYSQNAPASAVPAEKRDAMR